MKKLLTLISLILFAFASIASAELVKQTVVDKMEVLQNGTVQVREAIRVVEDGKVISQQFHRYVVSPGDDYSKREDKVKAVCDKVQTQTIIDAYKNPSPPIVTPGLVKEIKVDKIHVLEDGTIVARTTTKVLDDGKEIGKSQVQEKIVPGDSFEAKTTFVKDICTVIQTKEVVDAYKAAH